MKILTYKSYLDLLNALDEHTKCKYSIKELDKMIFQHFIKSSFIVINRHGTRALYTSSRQQNDFIRFLNTKHKYDKIKSKTENNGSLSVCSTNEEQS